MLAVTAATIISPVQAQVLSPAAAPPQWPPAAYLAALINVILFLRRLHEMHTGTGQ